MQIGILEPQGFSPVAINLLSSAGSLSTHSSTNLPSFLAPLEALFIRLSYTIDSQFLQFCPNLRYLCSPTTGHNHIDLDYLQTHNIKLLSLKGERSFLDSIRATPEHTFGLILALLRNYNIATRASTILSWDRDICIGEEIFGNKIGIIGLGRVGYRLAQYLDSFGAQVFWYDINSVLANSKWTKCDDIASLIKLSRVICLCSSQATNSLPIINSSHIELMKNRYFVNTARGELVDESALLHALSCDHFAGLALDVLANENSSPNFPFLTSFLETRNLIVTPHIAGATTTSMMRTEEFIASKLLQLIDLS